VRSGVKFYISLPKLLEYLNEGQQEQFSVQAT
jgi:hypothetical protein